MSKEIESSKLTDEKLLKLFTVTFHFATIRLLL